MNIKIKRIYEKKSNSDGYRILVDRLWPRGLTKSEAKIDLWLKEIAPSNGLRKWYHQNPNQWKQFKSKYNLELKNKSHLKLQIKTLAKEYNTITFLYSAKDKDNNNAIVLKEILT